MKSGNYLPMGQGIAALQMLSILETYNFKEMEFASPEYLHLLIKAKKLAFEDRAKYCADPEYNTIPVDLSISKGYPKQRKELIDPDKAAASYDPGELTAGETLYLTMADEEGNRVSLIQSNYTPLVFPTPLCPVDRVLQIFSGGKRGRGRAGKFLL